MNPESTDELTASRTGLDGRRWWVVLAVVAVVACALVHLSVAWSARQPSFPFDEVSVFQMSRMLAGEATPDVRGAGYFPGWAVLLAPLWWVVDDPTTFYRLGVFLGVVVGLFTIVPLTALAQRYGVDRPQAVVAAAIVMALPARAVQADYLLSERLLVLFTVLAVLAAHRLAERPGALRALELACWLGLGLFTHARLLPVLLAAGIWLLLFALRNVRAALVGLLGLAIAGSAAQWAGKRLNEALLNRPFDQDDPMSDVLAQLTPGLAANTFLGQSWYQVVASFGVIALGVVLLLGVVWREVRRWHIGGGVFILGVSAAAVLSSMLRWADAHWLFETSWVRLDVWLYGRYADSVTVVLVLIGVTGLIAAASWVRQLVALLGVAVLCAPVVLWLAPHVPTWGYVTPAHIPGILPFWPVLPEDPWPRTEDVTPTFSNENSVWLIASATVLLVLVGLILLHRWPHAAVSALLIVACVASVGADPRSNRFQHSERADLTAVDSLHSLEGDGGPIEVVYDTGCSRGGARTAVSQNYLGFYVLPTVMGSADVSASGTEAPVVISCADWEQADELQARPLAGEPIDGSTFWVLPGEVQDRAAAEGLLR